MTISARSVAYRNKGETVSLGVNLVDENGADVTITGSVSLVYRDPDDVQHTAAGSTTGNTAYYISASGVGFETVGKYRWWFDIMGQTYGPYELEILDV